MTIARRTWSIALLMLAAAIIFSPFVAALSQSTFDLADAFRHLARPLSRSLTVAAIAAIVAVTIGLPFALIVDRASPLLRRLCWGLALLALIVPPYIVAESTVVLFGPAGNISRGIALMVGLGPAASEVVARARFTVPGFVYTAASAGVVLGGCFFPIVALAVASANRRIDRRMFESARLIAGARGVAGVAAGVLIAPTAGAALLVFAIALTESVVPQLLRVRTIGEAIYEQIQEGKLSAAAGTSLPLLPLIFVAGALGAFLLLRARSANVAGLEGEIPQYPRLPAGAWANGLAIAKTTVAALPALLVPIVGLGWLLATATLPPASEGTHRVLRASGFFDSLLGAWDLTRDDAMRTIALATLTATLATTFAIALVRMFSRTRGSFLLGMLAAGLAVPAPIVGLGLIVLWNRGFGIAVYESSGIVVLAWLSRFLAVAVLLVQAALARVPIELEHAAALSGRGPIARLVSVVLPSAAPGLVAAWLAVYVLSATEFSATLLVSPPGAPLLAPSIVNLMRRGQDAEIAACQVLLLAVVGAPLLFAAVVSIARPRWRTTR